MSRREGRIIGAAFAALGLLLAWQITATLFSDLLAESQPEAALQWQSDHGVALRRRAEELILADPGALPASETLIARALAADPLSTEAIRTAALIEDGKGNTDRAAALMEIAASRSLYEAPARLWLLRYHAQREDAARVVETLNALLAMAPMLPGAIRTRLMDGLLALSVSGDTSALILAELAKQPSWRDTFLRRLAENAPESALATELFARLQLTASPPSSEEIAPLLTRLVREGNYEVAYLIWIGSLDMAEGREIANVYNGGFEFPPTPGPFDWSLRRNASAEIAIAPRADEGNALRIRFRGGQAAFRDVWQTLFLNPGEYELSGEVRVESQGAPPELEWVVLCPGGDLIARTQAFARTRGWASFNAIFSVPAECAGQQLRLQHSAAADRSAAGEVWFDNLQAVRVGPPR